MKKDLKVEVGSVTYMMEMCIRPWLIIDSGFLKSKDNISLILMESLFSAHPPFLFGHYISWLMNFHSE